jgi:hypothetical protein
VAASEADAQDHPAGTPRQVGDYARVGEVAEVRHIDRKARDLMLARRSGSSG